MIRTVIKRDGSREQFDPEKLNKWAEYATAHSVRWSEIAMATVAQLYDGCTTDDIHQAMINACTNKKTEKHLKVAARLLRGKIYKDVYGKSTPDTFRESYSRLVKDGYWEDFGLTEEQLDVVSDNIDHQADKNYEYTSLLQFIDKYALKRFVDGKPVIVETPQLMLMGISLALFKHDTLDHAMNFYHLIKERKINIATPIMAAARTGSNEFASCFLASAGDTLESISAGTSLCYTMTANRAGVGMEYAIRSAGDEVGKGKCLHAGKLPYYKMLVETIKATSQGSRGGAGTVSFNILDPEIDDLLRLKNPVTPTSKRIELLDYGVVLNNEFLRRVAKNEDWLLISIRDAPDLYDAFYDKRGTFSEVLNKYLEKFASGELKFNGGVLKAREIMKTLLVQRAETGRIYTFNVDNVNDHSGFEETVRISNLCHEVCLPTRPFKDHLSLHKPVQDGDGLVGLCFLLATDVARSSYEDLGHVNYYACRALDNILTMTDYPFEVLRDIGHSYRSIGVGITNLAYLMAKNGVSYSSESGRNLVHKMMEKHQYSLYEASVSLAKERGSFPWIGKTKLKDAITVIDTYKRDIDAHHTQPLLCNWSSIKEKIRVHGVRFATHSAMMPCESSSVFGYSTNGPYPIRVGRVMKSRPEGLVPFFAPEFDTLKDQYELAWDIETQDLYKIYGIIQKFTDQGISADTYLPISSMEGGKAPLGKLMKDFLFSQKIGMKTHYYMHSQTENKDAVEDTEEDCASCKL